MRVETEKLMEAAYELSYLQNWLSRIADETRQIRSELTRYSVGSSVSTDAIITTLAVQIKALDARIDSFRQMAHVLDTAAEQYEHCERQNASPSPFFSRLITDATFYYDPHLKTVPFDREQTIIQQFIMPLYVAGKQGDT